MKPTEPLSDPTATPPLSDVAVRVGGLTARLRVRSRGPRLTDPETVSIFKGESEAVSGIKRPKTGK
jgi:hypothetical protein